MAFDSRSGDQSPPVLPLTLDEQRQPKTQMCVVISDYNLRGTFSQYLEKPDLIPVGPRFAHIAGCP